MARWGSCDYKQLIALQKRLNQAQVSGFDTFCREAAKELAARLLSKVTKRTPVVYGTLRKAWAVLPVEKHGANYTIVVINNLEYASYVEFGHRQEPGRFIPGYWSGGRFVYQPEAKGGMVLKKGWVKGRFMMTISETELKAQAPKILENKLNRFLKECFSNSGQ